MERLSFAIVLLMFCDFFAASKLRANERCQYDLYRYNVKRKMIEGPERIVKNRSELAADMVDPETGCSVCEEDQVAITLYNGISLKVCRYVATRVERALNKTLLSGFQIQEATGYIVKQTRGGVDGEGYRTKLSNHSFGLSIDVNRAHNGLYENCYQFDDRCSLAHGGRWSVSNKLSITSSGQLVKSFAEYGFLWGGQIKGAQKDFMHFSPTGY